MCFELIIIKSYSPNPKSKEMGFPSGPLLGLVVGGLVVGGLVVGGFVVGGLVVWGKDVAGLVFGGNVVGGNVVGGLVVGGHVVGGHVVGGHVVGGGGMVVVGIKSVSIMEIWAEIENPLHAVGSKGVKDCWYVYISIQ